MPSNRATELEGRIKRNSAIQCATHDYPPASISPLDLDNTHAVACHLRSNPIYISRVVVADKHGLTARELMVHRQDAVVTGLRPLW
jgi:hypothetical protein